MFKKQQQQEQEQEQREQPEQQEENVTSAIFGVESQWTDASGVPAECHSNQWSHSHPHQPSTSARLMETR